MMPSVVRKPFATSVDAVSSPMSNTSASSAIALSRCSSKVTASPLFWMSTRQPVSFEVKVIGVL